MALMGLLEPVWRLPLVPPIAENQQKIEQVLECASDCSPRGACCKLKSRALFDIRRQLYTDEHFALFQRFKEALNAGEVRAAEPDDVSAERLARERVGEEGHSAGIPHGRASWTCRSTRCGSRFSTNPLIR